jgi:hypothetical protein
MNEELHIYDNFKKTEGNSINFAIQAPFSKAKPHSSNKAQLETL